MRLQHGVSAASEVRLHLSLLIGYKASDVHSHDGLPSLIEVLTTLPSGVTDALPGTGCTMDVISYCNHCLIL